METHSFNQADQEIFERARLARDTRYDGRFFIAVRTTGIYCRPVCPANPPRSENITFYPTAAAAAEAGYRPCLRCRPETAPGTPAWAGTSTTVRRGLRLIAGGALDEGNIESLSARLGVSSRHLRRLFRQHLGATPQAVAHTQRLHLAKRLIDETSLPLGHIAEASGFGSVRRFNDAFLNSYGRAPGALRKVSPVAETEADQAVNQPPLSVSISYRQPFDWPALLGYLSHRAIPGVEHIADDRYLRSCQVGDTSGIIEVAADSKPGRLRLSLHGVPISSTLNCVQRIRELFDLEAPVEDITSALGTDPALKKRLAARPGIRVAGAWDGFELAIRAILGQQVTVAGASTLAGRLVSRFGSPIKDFANPHDLSVFPGPEKLANADIESTGVISSRANSIRSLAGAVANGKISLEAPGDPDELRKSLTALPGIGPWTAEYITMRVAKDPDAFPSSDLGLRKALVPGERLTAKQLEKQAEAWRPWRAYAAMLLWQTSTD